MRRTRGAAVGVTGALAVLAVLLLPATTRAQLFPTAVVQPTPSPPETSCCDTVTGGPVTTSPTTSTPAKPRRVKVPDLVGQKVGTARALLNAQYLALSTDDPDEYVVVDQDPPPGRWVRADTAVTVTARPPETTHPTTGPPTPDPPTSPVTGVSVSPGSVPGGGDPPVNWERVAQVGGGIALVVLAVLGLLLLTLRLRPRRPAVGATARAVAGYRPSLLKVAELPGKPTLTVALRPAVEPGTQTITESGRPA